MDQNQTCHKFQEWNYSIFEISETKTELTTNFKDEIIPFLNFRD